MSVRSKRKRRVRARSTVPSSTAIETCPRCMQDHPGKPCQKDLRAMKNEAKKIWYK